jgi:hypothetical protein
MSQFHAGVIIVSQLTAWRSLFRLLGAHATNRRTISWRGPVATYTGLIFELIRMPAESIPPKVRRIMRLRSIATLLLFAVAAVTALVGLGICVCCLIVYLKPEPLGIDQPVSG